MLATSLRLLLVSDDEIVARSLVDGLGHQSLSCDVVVSTEGARQFMDQANYECLLLDMALADGAALSLIQQARGPDDSQVIFALGDAGSRRNLLSAIELGADDFLLKPLVVDELLVRIEALQIRGQSRGQLQLEYGALRLDISARSVTLDGAPVALTPTEFRILELLMRNQGNVVSRRMFCEFLWNPDWEGMTNVIEVHINRLRSKLASFQSGRLIHTVRGRGYMLEEANEGAAPTSADTGPTAERSTNSLIR